MDIKVEDIEAFIKVAELQSFNQAADAVGLTQSALSRRLKKLEETLGTRLLDRTTRRVQLTAIGEEFLPKAHRMVRDFESSLAEIVDVIQIRAGIVTMASNFTIADTVLPDILEVFAANHPNIEVHVVEDSDPAGLARIRNGEAEFGILQIDDEGPDLETETLLTDQFVMVAHQDHPLAGKSDLTWAEVASHPFIRMNRASGTYRSLHRALDDLGIELKGKFEVAHLSALLSLVSKNLGISAVPGLGTMKRPDLNLVSCPIREPAITRSLGLVRRGGRTLSPAALALSETIRSVLRRTSVGASA